MQTTITNKAAWEKMGKAKALLVLGQPFFASIICNLPLYESTAVPTMGTNGDWVMYNPDFVESLTLEEVRFVLCHEVGHCMFQHMFRKGDRNHRGWNMAGDYVINDLLVREQVGSMPQGGLHNPQLVVAAGGTTEGVYDLLPESDKDGSKDGNQIGAAGEPLDDCQDAGGTPAEKEQRSAEMKIRVAQAAQAAKMCGKLSADMERFVGNALKAKVDWKNVLREFVTCRIKDTTSWARPKRRFIAQDLYLPAKSGDGMGEMVVAVDCSGSISDKEIDEFAAEIMAIHQDAKPQMTHVIYFAHEINHVDSFERDDEVSVTGHGTGGTAFSPIFREIAQRGWNPACCVVLTDLCCGDFGPEPEYPTLWVSNMPGTAPWGAVIEMNPRNV